MAKISAGGRRELRRMSIWRMNDPSEYDYDMRVERILCSDGRILEKRTFISHQAESGPGGRQHNTGWKVYGRIKGGLPPAEQFHQRESKIEQWVETYESNGWQRVRKAEHGA